MYFNFQFGTLRGNYREGKAWYFYKKVTQNTLRTREGKSLIYKFFFFKFAAFVDLNKGLKQIKLLISLHTCAPISELPSYIRTQMGIEQG